MFLQDLSRRQNNVLIIRVPFVSVVSELNRPRLHVYRKSNRNVHHHKRVDDASNAGLCFTRNSVNAVQAIAVTTFIRTKRSATAVLSCNSGELTLFCELQLKSFEQQVLLGISFRRCTQFCTSSSISRQTRPRFGCRICIYCWFSSSALLLGSCWVSAPSAVSL